MRYFLLVRKKRAKELSKQLKKIVLECARKAADEGYYDVAGKIMAKEGMKEEALQYASKVAKKGFYYEAGLIAAMVGAKDKALEYVREVAKKFYEYKPIQLPRPWKYVAGKIAAMVGAEDEVLKYVRRLAKRESWASVAEILCELLDFYRNIERKKL